MSIMSDAIMQCAKHFAKYCTFTEIVIFKETLTKQSFVQLCLAYTEAIKLFNGKHLNCCSLFASDVFASGLSVKSGISESGDVK